ncbi:hypothetical protein [Agriterribacter sp.]|nr:hypothetical protein [Agriterribacter sp.]HRP57139.1 hypothetical protein [Agriterribacter sp.]
MNKELMNGEIRDADECGKSVCPSTASRKNYDVNCNNEMKA